MAHGFYSFAEGDRLLGGMRKPEEWLGKGGDHPGKVQLFIWLKPTVHGAGIRWFAYG
jgi:hypothetical protein